MNKLTAYFKESLQEIKKVSWPTRQETYRYTILVVLISLVMAAFLGGLDYLFNLALEKLISR